jgi:Zn-dependent protease
LDLNELPYKISIWAIPVLSAVTLHEVAHGWAARFCGDRTAELLGRLSLNPLRHIDPVGTILVPLLLLLLRGPLIGWARPVPVAIRALRNPRRSMVFVALAGPAANFAMAAFWCLVLAAMVHLDGSATLVSWCALMAQAGIIINVVLGLFNLLPIPPLDGGRILGALLPAPLGASLDRIEPYGFLVVVGIMGLIAYGPFKDLFDPAYRLVGRVIGALLGTAA